MSEEVVCCFCGRVLQPFVEWRCPSCGGPGDLVHQTDFKPSKIKKNIHSMWRYREMLAPSMRRNIVSLGEGLTPIHRTLSTNIYMKLEYIAPTGSFKDRGSAALFTSLLNTVKDVKGVVEDSSGNAGASIAAYAAAAGLQSMIFCGENVVAEKAMQVRAYGSELVVVRGSREQVAETAQQEAVSRGFVYVGHAWSPHFIEGMKTVAYEIAEQSKWAVPDRIYLPVSAGTLLLGLVKGFRDLLKAGLIDKIPLITAVQTLQRPALYEAFKGVALGRGDDKPSIADALTLTTPPRLRQMVEELKSVGGDVEVVSDEAVVKAVKQLGLMGVYAEPSSAVAYAAVRSKLDDLVASGESVMVVLTGFGCKAGSSLQKVE
ncbi:MAG: pyridoxal-phosphate dependent enzyme [Candidatus Caldarchaeum sp.]|nr:pyridoxal-phosphate dependent enzyme [Candidatus Caldarchaeum sp.]MCS7137658.1 pyridoxal-phosphate dependent enzyme [Candidatus Caldarchaeum sp.]MDW7977403.1 pyridoxal-phosphate dependent enzyme [Candidatus Caldarchaeum sp.]MDW8358976.1 pyridoxal-phosphate dependent enzyme [Candidatus Caldarchaeum sp.]